MISMVITNLSSDQVFLPDLYQTLGASGSDTDTVTVNRTVAQIDSMEDLKSKLNSGVCSVLMTASGDNVDIMSIPLEQHGRTGGVDVSAPGVVVTPVVFTKPFPDAVVPRVYVTKDMTDAGVAIADAYVTAVTNIGFNAVVNVTTPGAALTTCVVNWMAVY